MSHRLKGTHSNMSSSELYLCTMANKVNKLVVIIQCKECSNENVIPQDNV